MTEWRYDADAGIQGDRIVACARIVSKVRVVAGSGRHQTQQVALTENAQAWIERPKRAILEKKPSDPSPGKTAEKKGSKKKPGTRGTARKSGR